MSEAPVYRVALSRAPAEEGGYFVLSYTGIPGCLGVGDMEAEAKGDGRRALIDVLDALKAVDRPLPEVKGAGA